MQTRTKPGRCNTDPSNSEAGIMLVYVVLVAALMLIALAAAAPVVAKDLQRDKEVESAHRANQYVRAIRLYYNKFKTYPPSIDALQNTNNVRFLRKQYIDPLTGKADWRIIHVGENKTTVKGFFGQPLGGLNSTGAGSGSPSGLGTGFGGATSGSTSSSTVSGGSALSAGFQGATFGGSSNSPSTPGGTSSSPNGGTNSGTSNSNSSSSSSSGPGGSIGQIMGVGTARTGESIMDPNQQTTYETWEFIYDPKIELLYQQGNILGGGVSTMSPSSNPASSPGQSNTPGGSNSTTPTSPQPTAPQPMTPQ